MRMGSPTIVYLSRPSNRRFPRYKFESSVDISLMRGETPTMVEGFCQVLGEGGAGLRSDEPLSVHEILYVEIPFPKQKLRLPAVVRNQRGHDYGLEFLAMGTPEREFIRNTCSALPRVG
jgi:hypothetical protein